MRQIKKVDCYAIWIFILMVNIVEKWIMVSIVNILAYLHTKIKIELDLLIFSNQWHTLTIILQLHSH
jgi:hypothetical protein